MAFIDAHLHFAGDHTESVGLLEELDTKLLNVCVAHDQGEGWRQREAELYRQLHQKHPERYAWCTTFSLPVPGESARAYARRVIESIEHDLVKGGAVACKVWKNVGMELRDLRGRFIMVDDPLFEPIFVWLESRGTPLLMHIAEPLACWLPLDTASPHQAYYQSNPQWHMHVRADMPSHSQLIAARDAVARRHPRLTVVGAHLGSLEYSIPELARRFDLYPNYMVDTSARLRDLMSFDPIEARAFFIQYQDRIMFGTDVIHRKPQSAMDPHERRLLLDQYRSNHQMHQTYFGTNRKIEINGTTYQGIGLPGEVCDKVMCRNARRIYPGI